MPSQQWQADNARTDPTVPTRATPGSSVSDARVHRADVDAAGAFTLGGADTVTFGFLDEIGGFVDTLGGTAGRSNVWNSHKTFSELLSENIDENRSVLHQAEDEHGGAFLAGQLAGGLVPVGGELGALKATKGLVGAELKAARAANLGRIVMGSSIMGGLYGIGSADGDFGDRMTGGATGAAVGALGGYVFGGIVTPLVRWGAKGTRLMLRKGKDVAIDAATLPERKLATAGEDVPLETPKATPKKEPAGLDTSVKLGVHDSVSDTVEEGALLSARELLGEPGAARKALTKRIGELTPQQAQRFMERIQEAEANGTVVTDPHYRSLLGIDLSDTKLTHEEVLQAAELFEEATNKLAAKAGLGPKTVKGMDSEVGKELKKGVTLGDLEDAYDKSKKGYVDVRKAQHVVFSTMAKVVRLREELMGEVLKGTEGARERLADELTDVAHRFTLARGILSNAGRNLGILAHGVGAKEVNVADDLYALADPEAIRKRVNASLAQLGDHDLAAALNKLRTMADADKLEQLLLNPENAAAFSAWQRTVNSVSLFMRSNALTPATAIFNVASMLMHDFFRNDIAKSWAAKGLIQDGKIEQGLALQLERQAGRAVYWNAHKQGLKALMKRVQWEFWGDVERIAGVGWQDGMARGAVAKARLKQSTMLADGFVPPNLREFTDKARLSITDVDAFNEKLAATRGDTALANVVYHLNRARAVVANTADALGSASMKVFTGAVDDWGREFVRVKETYAQTTRFAIREALAAGVPQDNLGAYVEKRAKELAELPTAEIMQRVDAALVAADDLTGEAAFLKDLHKTVQQEADEVLFMDGPQSELGKKSASFLQKVDRLGIVLPYIKTPIRLFEQGVVNYGPFGKLSREVRDILAAGARPTATEDQKLAAALMNAKVEVGTMVFQAGLVAGIGGAATATNGGFENSGNLDAGPPGRLNFPGGGFMEFRRLDPFAFTFGIGAMVGQAFKAGYADGTEYDQAQALRTGIAMSWLGFQDQVMGKSYLKGLEDLSEMVTSKTIEEAGRSFEKILGNAAGRFLPLAGTGRQINETFSPSQTEAVGFMDQILRSIPGAGYGMAPKVDPLGDEVKSRTVGIEVGNSETTHGDPVSPVKAELRRLGIDISTIRSSDPDGFNLTSDELSEVRKVRGKEALNSQGLTMSEALQQLFSDPYFQALPSKDQKRSEVVDTMREFNKPAWDILAERNPGYASKKTYYKSLTDYIAEGMKRDDAEASAQADVGAEGLPAPQL